MKTQTLFSGPFRFLPPTLSVVLLTFVVSGCRPDLPIRGSNAFPTSAPREFVLRIEPDAPLDAAPRVLRAHATWPDPIDKERVFLIRGEVTDYHLRQIQRNDWTKTLEERIVPTIVWPEDERNVVIAPTIVLEKGQTYAIASGDPSKVVHFVVRKEDDRPLSSRIWPPLDVPSQLGIFCGEQVLPDLTIPMNVEPLGFSGVLARGIVENGPGKTCFHFQIQKTQGRSEEDEGGALSVLPPILEIPELESGLVQIDPAPFSTVEMVSSEIAPVDCERNEVAFGPGCAFVMDDRLSVRAPAGELLWGISGAGMDRVFKTAKKERFVVKGLLPESDISLDVVTIDPFGRTRRETFLATTSALSAHVILNEVLANPLGPEPQQEWLELFNDGQAETSLLGYHLLDIGGDTPFPDVILPAGRYAVVVNEEYVADEEVDIAPPEDAILIRVPSLGKNGLSNSGELLRLIDPEGRTISRFPALPKPKAGQSVSRLAPDASDGVSTSFVTTEPTPGLRNVVGPDP